MPGAPFPPPKAGSLPTKASSLPTKANLLPPKAGSLPQKLPHKAGSLPQKAGLPPPKVGPAAPVEPNPPPAKPLSAEIEAAPANARSVPTPAEAAPVKAGVVASKVSPAAVEPKAEPTKICFVIGPPAGPQDMRDLYERAGEALQSGDDSIAKKLFVLRRRTVEYITLPDPRQKPMLQRLLEEKLGKELRQVETTIEETRVRGSLVPILTISLKTSLYADGSPIAADLSGKVIKTLVNTLGFVLQAQWVEPQLK
ncbi:hypothetical protein [Telmatospirillum sp.]|uniref:hypothetical protein n=1 Tax=Telmatospirillum sp. TaxID=2079197 RepID=UPI00284BDE6B|nr:hypothetical protein [Telmatospirillum sp.]MDR3439534.1 hypothetical protein [Telmatospirillum sp.]